MPTNKQTQKENYQPKSTILKNNVPKNCKSMDISSLDDTTHVVYKSSEYCTEQTKIARIIILTQLYIYNTKGIQHSKE
jgi:hypothetical protein